MAEVPRAPDLDPVIIASDLRGRASAGHSAPRAWAPATG